MLVRETAMKLSEFFEHMPEYGIKSAFIDMPEYGGKIYAKTGRVWMPILESETTPNRALARAFMVGQIERRGREKNSSYSQTGIDTRTGKLRPMLDEIQRVANANEFEMCLYSVINEFLPNVLIRYGFVALSADTFIRERTRTTI